MGRLHAWIRLRNWQLTATIPSLKTLERFENALAPVVWSDLIRSYHTVLQHYFYSSREIVTFVKCNFEPWGRQDQLLSFTTLHRESSQIKLYLMSTNQIFVRLSNQNKTERTDTALRSVTLWVWRKIFCKSRKSENFGFKIRIFTQTFKVSNK